MPDSGLNTGAVAPALSTAQTEETFSLYRYDSDLKDRVSYLGPQSQIGEESLVSSLNQYYAVEEIAEYLLKNEQFRHITLQFPDSLVQDSSLIVQSLQEKLDLSCSGVKRKIWTLADTAYSACCVDEVASEHVKGDLVIHFGDACLNAVQSLPVLYAFGKPYLDLPQIISKFKDVHKDKEAKICLMADAPYSYGLAPLCDALEKDGFQNILYAIIDDSLAGNNAVILHQSSLRTRSYKEVGRLGNRVLVTNNNEIEPLDATNKVLRDDYALFHITIPQDPHLLFLTTQFNSIALYDPSSGSINEGPFPSLMKRYRNMHIARTAGCIGILVNTLSLKNTKEMINTLIRLIHSKGKKHYLFVVGKPNVAKLANFEPIEVWCILGCGQSGIILDQYNEFYKPIITPYELTMALQEDVTWTGQWMVGFSEVLAAIEEDVQDEQSSSGSAEDPDQPEFDAVTGKYVSTARPLRQIRHLEIGDSEEETSTSLIQSVSGGVLIKGTVSTAAAQMQNRQWQGLGSDFASQSHYEEDGATVEEGISGVASSYQFDRITRNAN
ncbi:hypothetical protein HG536_0C05530 [Torulaspora globosa]|uniref:2-(3-amino-3-carboxypropyl)histidine synthase subunit 2 n=1 Tax=Torulaspora globosa TaxID=48254 RepID=A0A7G3ZFU8_9SACH|nr:uncharacterized protein HG536_0C05530 [Torulaspora globosa]QLL32384.1 hypothetical protein HG536_0C05530 [Torulaspora globosa]